MRLLTIFLILYLPQVTAGVAPCDQSLIKEESDPIVGFEFNNGMLKCKDNKAIVIKRHRVQYDDLKCDIEQNSWVYGSSKLTPTTKADKELNFECKAKACDISYVKGAEVAEIKFNGGNLTCKDDKYIVVDGDRYDELFCDVSKGWMNGDRQLINKNDEKEKKSTDILSIECKGKACDKSYIKGVEPGKDAKYINNKLSCTNPLQNIGFRGSEYQELVSELTCDEDKGWWFQKGGQYPEVEKFKNADEQIDVKCGAIACNEFLINYPDINRMKPYNSAQKILECNETFEIVWIHAIGESYKHASAKLFRCNPSGKWKNGSGKSTLLTATDKIYAKCEVIECHRDLINGTADKSEQHVLKCFDNKVLQIHGDSNFYKTLKCVDSKWFDPTDQKKVKSATEKFTIDCIAEPCTYQATGIVYDSVTRTLSCHPGEIEHGGTSHKSLTCDGRAGWSENGGTIVAPAEPKLVVNCKHFCTTTADVEYKMSSDGSYAVTCKEFAVILYDDSGTKKELKDVMCSKNDGWKAENFSGIPSDSKLVQLECKKACDKHRKPKDPSDPDSTNDAKWEDGLTDLAKQNSKGPRNVQFECNNLEAPKYVIQMNGKLMDSHLNCDAGGYTDNIGTKMGSALDTVKIACVKICVTPADVEYKISDDGTYAVTCRGVAIMEYNDGHGKKEVKDMRCSVDGWIRDGNKIGKSSDRPLQQLSCKRACSKHQKPKTDPSDQNKWEDGLTDLAEEISEGPGKVQFECKNKRFGDEKSLIKINSKFVNSHLKCDFDGYTDIHGTKLADAFTTVNIECVDSPCKIPSREERTSCSIRDTNDFECYNSLFSYNEDTYQLRCKPKNSPQYLYDYAAKKFLEDKPVMCKEKDHFYFYGDANQEKISNINNFLCVRKRCNSCEKLLARRGGTGVDNYSPGTADKCATDSYPNNYWMIMKEYHHDSKEEYEGEVTCSSKYNGEWLINADSDHPTPIVAGYCIASVTKKCTVNSPLNVECDYAWDFEARCSTRRLKLFLGDFSDLKCDYDKKMFYKKQDAKYFEEGAEKIECDTTKGVWTVKKSEGNDELRKGDTVICAKKNPLPKHPSDGKHGTHAEMAIDAQKGSSAVIGFSILGVILLVIIVIAIVANRKMKQQPKGKQAQKSNNEANKIPENPEGVANKDSKGVANTNSVHSDTPVVNPV